MPVWVVMLALVAAQAEPPPGLEQLVFLGDHPIGSFVPIVEQLALPEDDEGAPVHADELRAILNDPRAQQIYWNELAKYAHPRSVKNQNAAHKSYVRVFLAKARLQEGVEFLEAHRAELDRAEARFGVAREDIVSVLMWESNLGRITGKFLVVNTYIGELLFLHEVFAKIERKEGPIMPPAERESQLARVARLQQNASRFLIALLRTAKAKNVDPLEIRGSWAGAIGFPQFMPTSMRWAVDGDEDGHIDLYSFADAIPSIGSYLRAHGYEKDRFAAIFAYNADSEYVRGVQAYADAIAKLAAERRAAAPDAATPAK